MPRQAQRKVDNTILEMAIVGYQSEHARLSAKIADIKERLGLRGPGRPKAAVATATGPDHAAPKKRRRMSKSARARIAAAQKARWAEKKKQQAAPATRKKRKMSAAGLRAIREATKKRWATWRKAKKAAA